MNFSGCTSLRMRRLQGLWYRAIPPQFWTQPLNSVHTSTIPSRFGAGSVAHPGFKSFYLAESHLVALFEVNALLGSFHGAHVPNPLVQTTIIPLTIDLQYVVDLTRFSERKHIRTNIQELTGDWRSYRLRKPVQPVAPPHTEVPTPKLGQALFDLPDLEGFVCYSAKVPTLRNIVVFPQKLKPGNSVAYVNPLTSQRVQIP